MTHRAPRTRDAREELTTIDRTPRTYAHMPPNRGGGRRGRNRFGQRSMAVVVLMALALGLVPQVLGATASISLTPSQATAGATITVTGTGFPKKVDGSLTFDGSGAGMPTYKTNGGGGISVTFRVPAGASLGTHVIRATAGGSSASANLLVANPTPPPPTPSPTPVPTPTAVPTATPVPTPDPNDVGTRGPTYPSTVVEPTGQKPQSKLWINDGFWWGVLFNSTANRFEIYRFDWPTSTWIATGVAVDTRPNSSADVLWDGGKLLIVTARADLSSTTSPPLSGDRAIRVLRYSYVAATRTYTLDTGYPVTLATAAVEAAVIDKDSIGTYWVTWTYSNGSGGRNVYMTHSTTDAAHWSTPYVLPVAGANNLWPDDISAVVAYDGKMGVMWSNQAEDAMYFASHSDGTSDQSWVINPAVKEPKYADDHLSLRAIQADGNGRVFATVKTSQDDVSNQNSQAPLILFLQLDRSGTWKRSTVSTVAEAMTRPQLLIDSENQRAYVFATHGSNTITVGGRVINGGAIYYKSASINDRKFESGFGTRFIRLGASTTSLVNNPSATKQSVNSSTGILILASDDGARTYMFNKLAVAPYVPIPPTANDGSLTVSQNQSGTGTLVATDPNVDALTYSIVSNGSRGTATVTDSSTGAYQYVPNAGASGTDSFTFKANDGTADSNVATISVTIVSTAAERGTWLLDDGSGTTFADSSGLGNNGTLIGSPTWVAGRHGTALRFNGTTDYGVVANNANLSITGPITLSAWIKPERLATQYIVKKAKVDAANGYELGLSGTSGKVFFRLNQLASANTYRVESTSSYPVNGTWMHVAATYDGATMRVYVNGVEEASVAGPASILTNSQPLGIGAQGDGLSPLQGTIDEARVLAQALSATEIQALRGTYDAPTATDGSLSTNQDQTGTGTLSATDPNADPLTYSIVSNGGLGTATVTNASTGAYQYVPNAGASGSDTFTFKANDGTADSNVATISVTIVPIVPPPSERGTWLLDEGSGATIADSSGLANNGTLTGSPSWVVGRHGTALRFNGSTDYAVVPNSSSLNITGPITLSAWIKPERLATQYIVKKAKIDAANGYELSLSAAGKVFFRLNQASSLNAFRVDSTSSYPITGTTWMHVAATYDGTTMRLYINGVLEASVAGPASILTNSQPLGIGAQGDGLSPLQGTIDEARILNRALTAAEIQGLLGP